MFWQQLAKGVMPVETGRLIEVVHIACGGFFRFVHCGEVVPLFIPWFRIIMGDFLAGLYSKLAFGEGCPPFFGSLCFSVLKCEDISHAFFYCAEINAACAVVMACAERQEFLKHIVEFFACFNLLSHAKAQKRKDFKTIAH